MSINKIKIPIRREDDMKRYVNVTKSNPYMHPELDYVRDSRAFGKPNFVPSQVDNVLKHEYLRKSMVDRIEKKNAISLVQKTRKKNIKDMLNKPNRASQLRSISIQEQISKSGDLNSFGLK